MKVFIRFVLGIILLSGCISNTQKVENLGTFAKVYGYVKYFHPSDEASDIDWAKFSMYGAREIEKCRTSKQVVETLNRLFLPIGPSIRFSVSQTEPDYDLKIITPDDTTGYSLTYWQHQGIGLGMEKNQIDAYKSVRVNRGVKKDAKIFEQEPKLKDIITRKISNDIYCQVPQVLYCNDKTTYPKADQNSLKKLKENLALFDHNKEHLALKTGDVIIAYNVFQHFYPYFDVVDVNWDDELKNALSRSFLDKTLNDHFVTIEKFTAALKDGHVYVNYPSKYAAPSIWWEWIENKLVITHNYKNNPNINVGDIVTQINGINSAKYFEEINSRISAGTNGWLAHRAEMKSLLGDKATAMKLEINDRLIEIQLEVNPYDSGKALTKDEKRYKQISDNIYYLNMDMIEMDTINKLLPALEKCKAIICDARGYPKGNHDFIMHLMKTDDTTSSWMQVPQIIYPDHENNMGYKKYNWLMKAKKPYLGDKKIVYIIDGSAISYAESCLGYIEGYKLATIVGQPSAGTNGNVNAFVLPGGCAVTFTGMKVLKHNGSQHHGIGILPNVYVTKTIQGIKDGRDEFFEKAIEIAKGK